VIVVDRLWPPSCWGNGRLRASSAATPGDDVTLRLLARRLPAASALMFAARGNAGSFSSARAFPSLTRSGRNDRFFTP
jgi:hypothetical protein